MNDSAHICVSRHGETDWNIAGILQGWTDTLLNDLGRRQAHELAAAVACCRLSRVYSSPLRRSLETAEIISRLLRLPPPLCHEGLKERNFGVIQGVPKAELNPAFLEQIVKRNPACFFDQGETMEGFADRVLAAIAAIARDHAGERVLVITHGWVMDVITRHILNLPPSAILNMKRKNGECLSLAATEDSISLHPADASLPGFGTCLCAEKQQRILCGQAAVAAATILPLADAPALLQVASHPGEPRSE